jgi:hypothetical protein
MELQPRRQTLAQTTTMVCPQNNNMMDIRNKIYKKSPEHDRINYGMIDETGDFPSIADKNWKQCKKKRRKSAKCIAQSTIL